MLVCFFLEFRIDFIINNLNEHIIRDTDLKIHRNENRKRNHGKAESVKAFAQILTKWKTGFEWDSYYDYDYEFRNH